MPNKLTISDLNCSRGEQRLFSGLQFELKSGEALQIRGLNGSGKTSLLRMIAGLAFISEGEIHWNGKLIHDPSSDYLNHINYIGHKPGFNDNLTALENLRYSCQGYACQYRRNLLDALDIIKLSHRKDLLARDLSAGQKKRIALAKLLVLPNSLWVLDEPFSAIDTLGVELIQQLMQEHLQQGGMILFTSHQEIELNHAKREINLNA